MSLSLTSIRTALKAAVLVAYGTPVLTQDLGETIAPPMPQEPVESKVCEALRLFKENGTIVIVTNQVGHDHWQSRLDAAALKIGRLLAAQKNECNPVEDLNSEFKELTREMQQIHADYAVAHDFEILSPVDGDWGPLTTQDFYNVSIAAQYYGAFLSDTDRQANVANFFLNEFALLLKQFDDTEFLRAYEEALEATRNSKTLNNCTGQSPNYTGLCGNTMGFATHALTPSHG